MPPLWVWADGQRHLCPGGSGGRQDETKRAADRATTNLRTNIMDFRGFDSSRVLISRGVIPRPIGDFVESVTQAMLVGVMLVGTLSVCLASTASLTVPTSSTWIRRVLRCSSILASRKQCTDVHGHGLTSTWTQTLEY